MYLSYKFCFLKLNCGSTIDEEDYLILTKPDEQENLTAKLSIATTLSPALTFLTPDPT